VQTLLRRIPKNSRVLVTDITGSNDIRADYIQSVITGEAKGITILTDEGRASAIEMQKNLLSGSYSSDNVILGNMDGASIIVTGGVFGSGDSRRIVFRAFDVTTWLTISVSCVLFTQNNNELINNFEEFSSRITNRITRSISNGSVIAVFNNATTSRNSDFAFDIIETSLVNLNRYGIGTRSEHNRNLIQKEWDFQMNYASDGTMMTLGRAKGADYIVNISFSNNRFQINLLDVMKGNSIFQEIM